MKEIFFGPKPEPSELEYNKEVKSFPAEDGGVKVTKEEFRKAVEEQRPKEVYARYHYMDDLAAHGTFYMRLQDGSVIKADSYYPLEDTKGNVGQTLNPISVLDNLPYQEVLGKLHQSSLSLYFKAKYVLRTNAD